jgi:hypothetical protein
LVLAPGIGYFFGRDTWAVEDLAVYEDLVLT